MKKSGLIVLLLGAIVLGYSWRGSVKEASVDAEAEARHFVQQCAGPGDHAECYEKNVPKLVNRMSVEDIFRVITAVRAQDAGYQFCHVLAHKIGRSVVARDPDHWMHALSLNPNNGLCSNGYMHGVILGRYGRDALSEEQLAEALPDLSRACDERSDWHPTELDRAICYHGLGHLFDFITDLNIPKALSLCQATGVGEQKDFSRVCREGVFMQLYQPLEPDDFLLLKHLPYPLTKTSYRRFCGSFSVLDQGACLREAWPLFREITVTGRGTEAFCSGQSPENTNFCYDSISAIVGRFSIHKDTQAQKICSTFPEDRRLGCFVAVARAIIEEDRDKGADAIAFCEESGAYADECLRRVAQTASFIFGESPRYQAFCSALPELIRDDCR